jgi:hypothetical protein
MLTLHDVRLRRGRWVLVALLLAWLGTAYWQTHKALAPGTHLAPGWQPVPDSALTFVADLTSADAYGRPIVSHAIFDEMLSVVEAARSFVVLDYFRVDDGGAGGLQLPLRPLGAQLRDALIARRQAMPGLRILVITDPLQEAYGSAPAHDLELLRGAGIDVVSVDLDRLRDSNFLYSGLWRLAMQWWGTGDGGGWLPNPRAVGPPRLTLRAFARLLNFKADRRAVLLADDGTGGLSGVVSSADPALAESADSNVALRLRGTVLQPLLASELAVARFSGWTGSIDIPAQSATGTPASESGARAQLLTEGAIATALLERIEASAGGDGIDIAMLYLSDRAVVDALLAASRRGVAVRLILDPNEDASAPARSGIPNQPTASALIAASDGAIRVRWYRTHGERFHAKLALVHDPKRLWVTLGSAHLTRRALDDYDLDANVALEIARSGALARQMLEYFDALWNNRAPAGIEYTADAGAYADPSQVAYWGCRIMEAVGLSTF